LLIHALEVSELALRQKPAQALKIGHDRLSESVVIQCCRGMIQWHDLHFSRREEPSVEMPDRVFLDSESLEDLRCCRVAERANDFWFQKLDLSIQVGRAGRDLFRGWLSVFDPVAGFLRGAAFDYVSDEHTFPFEADGLQAFVQEFACSAHERAAFEIFLSARAFPDEHYPRVGWAFTRHGQMPSQ